MKRSRCGLGALRGTKPTGANAWAAATTAGAIGEGGSSNARSSPNPARHKAVIPRHGLQAGWTAEPRGLARPPGSPAGRPRPPPPAPAAIRRCRRKCRLGRRLEAVEDLLACRATPRAARCRRPMARVMRSGSMPYCWCARRCRIGRCRFYLVHDQQQAALLSQRTQLAHKARVGDHDARFACTTSSNITATVWGDSAAPQRPCR